MSKTFYSKISNNSLSYEGSSNFLMHSSERLDSTFSNQEIRPRLHSKNTSQTTYFEKQNKRQSIFKPKTGTNIFTPVHKTTFVFGLS